jgi:hypothetical protein
MVIAGIAAIMVDPPHLLGLLAVPSRPLLAPREAARQRRPRSTRARPAAWWTWVAACLPAVVGRVLVDFDLLNFEQLIGGVVALMALVLLARRPERCISALLFLLPFQLLLTSMLFELGFSAGVARMAALWKELVVLAVVVAAWRRSQDRPGRFDPLDRMAAAFVALGTIYLVLPEAFVGDAGSALSVDTRFVAWRLVVLPSVLLLACRRLRLTSHELRTVLRGATAMAAAMGAVAIVEFAFSDWWNSLLVNTIGVNRYRVEALDLDLPSLGLSFFDIRVYGEVAGRQIIRAGGPMVSHLTFSFVLVIGLAVLVERLFRGDATPAVVLGVLASGVGLLFTQTRSSIVGAIVLVAVALRPAPGRRNRARYAVLASAVALVAIPVVLGAGLADRFTEGDELSDDVHEARVEDAVDTIVHHPLGIGLGMGSTAGGRPAEGAVSVENQVLDTAVQMGVLGSVLLFGQLAALIVLLRRAAVRAGPTSQTAAFAARTAILGLLVPLWYQQAFGLIEVSWVLFAIAGSALGAAEADAEALEESRVRSL